MKKIILLFIIASAVFWYVLSSEKPDKASNDKPKEKTVTLTVKESGQEEVPAPSATQEDQGNKEDAKNMALAFAKAYYTYDAAHPETYLEASKPFMDKEFYEYEKENPRRQTLDREKTKVLKTEVYPVDDPGKFDSIWNVVIEGQATNGQGLNTNEELWYWVLLDYSEGQWKVKGVKLQ